jgi:hypothetical protein
VRGVPFLAVGIDRLGVHQASSERRSSCAPMQSSFSASMTPVALVELSRITADTASIKTFTALFLLLA